MRLDSAPNELYLSSKYPFGGKTVFKNNDSNKYTENEFNIGSQFYNYPINSSGSGKFTVYLSFYRIAIKSLNESVPSNKFALQLHDYSFFVSKTTVYENFEPDEDNIMSTIGPIIILIIFVGSIVWCSWCCCKQKCCKKCCESYCNRGRSYNDSDSDSDGKENSILKRKSKKKKKIKKSTLPKTSEISYQYPIQNPLLKQPFNQNPRPTLLSPNIYTNQMNNENKQFIYPNNVNMTQQQPSIPIHNPQLPPFPGQINPGQMYNQNNMNPGYLPKPNINGLYDPFSNTPNNPNTGMPVTNPQSNMQFYQPDGVSTNNNLNMNIGSKGMTPTQENDIPMYEVEMMKKKK